jgi:hypothetical protein
VKTGSINSGTGDFCQVKRIFKEGFDKKIIFISTVPLVYPFCSRLEALEIEPLKYVTGMGVRGVRTCELNFYSFKCIYLFQDRLIHKEP